MSERIRGSYPGGPARDGSGGTDRPPVRVRRVRDFEDARALRSLASSRRDRRRRVVAGLALLLAVAFGVGTSLGRSSHETQATLTARETESRQRDVDISREVNRTLLQLWKMEDVEAARSRGVIR